MDEELIEDAIQLCDKAIRTMDVNDNFKKGLREISIEPIKEHGFQIIPDESVLYYKFPQTPEILHQNGVFDYTWWPDTDNHKKKSLGYHKVRFNYDITKEWIDKTIYSSISNHIPKARIEFISSTLYVYFKNESKPTLIPFDTDRESNNMKDVFELLYDQYIKEQNIRLKKSEIVLMVARMRKIDIEDLPTTFVKTAIKNINNRLKQNEKINGIISIEFDKQKDGYYLDVK